MIHENEGRICLIARRSKRRDPRVQTGRKRQDHRGPFGCGASAYKEHLTATPTTMASDLLFLCHHGRGMSTIHIYHWR